MSSNAPGSRPPIDLRDFIDDKRDNPPPYRQEPIFEGFYVEDDAQLIRAARKCRPNHADRSDGIEGGFVNPGFQVQLQNPQYPQHPPSCASTGQHVVTDQPQGAQPHAIIVQPIMENPPDDYMAYSICATLCCCWLVGFMAVARSRECRTAILDGNRELAVEKSRSALNTANTAVCLGILALIVAAGVVIGIRVASVIRYY